MHDFKNLTKYKRCVSSQSGGGRVGVGRGREAEEREKEWGGKEVGREGGGGMAITINSQVAADGKEMLQLRNRIFDVHYIGSRV